LGRQFLHLARPLSFGDSRDNIECIADRVEELGKTYLAESMMSEQPIRIGFRFLVEVMCFTMQALLAIDVMEYSVFVLLKNLVMDI